MAIPSCNRLLTHWARLAARARLDRRQQERDQNADDPDHNQELEQREGPAAVHGSVASERVVADQLAIGTVAQRLVDALLNGLFG